MGIRRIVLSGALVAGLSAGLMAAGAAGAAADRFDCTFYLLGHGYSGKIVDIGCTYGAQGDQIICEGSLRIAGVPDEIGREACRLAALV
jgi:hypothetical protein